MHAEIIIIGGGPAGLSTALHLARQRPDIARKVLILEKHKYPREKVCAGGILPDGLIILKRLGLNIQEVPSTVVEENWFVHNGSGHPAIRHGNWPAMQVVERRLFDHWLARRTRDAGITIAENTRVQAINRVDGNWVIDTNQGRITCKQVIGADGSTGICRRIVQPKQHLGYAVERHQPQGQKHKAVFEMNKTAQSAGNYEWWFPSQQHGQASTCHGIYVANIGKRHTIPRLGTNQRGAPIHWFSPWQPIEKDNMLLVGDAAGADGLLGEGISIALGYGRFAAEEICRGQNTNKSFKGATQRLRHSPLGKSLTGRWAAAQTIYRIKKPWIHELLWRTGQTLTNRFTQHWVLGWAEQG